MTGPTNRLPCGTCKDRTTSRLICPIFDRHYITFADGRFFDPSYGLGPVDDLRDYEDMAMEGAGINALGAAWIMAAPPNDHDPANPDDLVAVYNILP